MSWPATSESPAPGSAPTRAPLEGDPRTDPAAWRRAFGLRWWREILYVLAFYVIYSVVRNMQGSASVSKAHALDHARDLIHLERWLHIFNERSVQKTFIDYRGFIEFWNLFYGTFHFIVTAAASEMRQQAAAVELGRILRRLTVAGQLKQRWQQVDQGD